jgi:hypothetical protein
MRRQSGVRVDQQASRSSIPSLATIQIPSFQHASRSFTIRSMRTPSFSATIYKLPTSELLFTIILTTSLPGTRHAPDGLL